MVGSEIIADSMAVIKELGVMGTIHTTNVAVYTFVKAEQAKIMGDLAVGCYLDASIYARNITSGTVGSA
jgi:hypothetical protein